MSNHRILDRCYVTLLQSPGMDQMISKGISLETNDSFILFNWIYFRKCAYGINLQIIATTVIWKFIPLHYICIKKGPYKYDPINASVILRIPRLSHPHHIHPIPCHCHQFHHGCPCLWSHRCLSLLPPVLLLL